MRRHCVVGACVPVRTRVCACVSVCEHVCSTEEVRGMRYWRGQGFLYPGVTVARPARGSPCSPRMHTEAGDGCGSRPRRPGRGWAAATREPRLCRCPRPFLPRASVAGSLLPGASAGQAGLLRPVAAAHPTVRPRSPPTSAPGKRLEVKAKPHPGELVAR